MLVFVDSFSHYTNAFLGKKWDFRNTLNVVQDLTSGRFGAGGVTFSTANNGEGGTAQHLQKNYAGVSEIICAFAVKQTAIQLADGGWLVHFMSGSTVQLGLKIQQSGQLMLFSNNAPFVGVDPGGQWVDKETVLGQTTNSIQSSAWDFLEVRVVHDAAAGVVEIRCNGGEGGGANAWTELFEDLNTSMSGFDDSSSVIFGGHESPQATSGIFRRSQFILSDVHILNTEVNPDDALDPVDFIGDRHWEPITPTADATYTDWTPSTGTDHFALVDEVPPNESDYNSTDTVTDKDSFDVSAPTGPTTASALIALTMYLQKDTGGAVEVSGLMRLAGSDRNGTAFQVPNPYAFRQSFLASKPGGGAITLQNVIDGEFGYERTA